MVLNSGLSGRATSLSVIVPACNNSDVIEASLQSVEDSIAFLKDQPGCRETECEIVVVDDGSRDGTRKVIEGFTFAKDFYKVVLRPRMSSPSCSRNTGVEASSGDLLFFLDGDDLYLENHLFECCRLFLRDEAVDFVKAGVALSDPVHPDWRSRIGNSLVINLAVRRRCHQFVGGFPDVHLFDRRADRFEHLADIFRMFEDVFYNKLIAEFFKGFGLAVETVRYNRYPGNAFDRQYARFQAPAGEHGDDLDEEGKFRVQLCRALIDYKIDVLKRRK